MEEIRIDEATGEEREWSARLMASGPPWTTLGRGLEACRQAAFDPACVVLVARRGGEPLGFVRVHPRGVAGSPYVASIAVAPEARGLGIGTALLDAAVARFSPPARWLFLCVSSFNVRARALYERYGFNVVGDLPDYVVDGASETLMVKRLA